MWRCDGLKICKLQFHCLLSDKTCLMHSRWNKKKKGGEKKAGYWKHGKELREKENVYVYVVFLGGKRHKKHEEALWLKWKAKYFNVFYSVRSFGKTVYHYVMCWYSSLRC